jgi:hypothetical protein
MIYIGLCRAPLELVMSFSLKIFCMVCFEVWYGIVPYHTLSSVSGERSIVFYLPWCISVVQYHTKYLPVLVLLPSVFSSHTSESITHWYGVWYGTVQYVTRSSCTSVAPHGGPHTGTKVKIYVCLSPSPAPFLCHDHSGLEIAHILPS